MNVIKRFSVMALTVMSMSLGAFNFSIVNSKPKTPVYYKAGNDAWGVLNNVHLRDSRTIKAGQPLSLVFSAQDNGSRPTRFVFTPSIPKCFLAVAVENGSVVIKPQAVPGNITQQQIDASIARTLAPVAPARARARAAAAAPAPSAPAEPVAVPACTDDEDDANLCIAMQESLEDSTPAEEPAVPAAQADTDGDADLAQAIALSEGCATATPAPASEIVPAPQANTDGDEELARAIVLSEENAVPAPLTPTMPAAVAPAPGLPTYAQAAQQLADEAAFNTLQDRMQPVRENAAPAVAPIANTIPEDAQQNTDEQELQAAIALSQAPANATPTVTVVDRRLDDIAEALSKGSTLFPGAAAAQPAQPAAAVLEAPVAAALLPEAERIALLQAEIDAEEQAEAAATAAQPAQPVPAPVEVPAAAAPVAHTRAMSPDVTPIATPIARPATHTAIEGENQAPATAAAAQPEQPVAEAPAEAKPAQPAQPVTEAPAEAAAAAAQPAQPQLVVSLDGLAPATQKQAMENINAFFGYVIDNCTEAQKSNKITALRILVNNLKAANKDAFKTAITTIMGSTQDADANINYIFDTVLASLAPVANRTITNCIADWYTANPKAIDPYQEDQKTVAAKWEDYLASGNAQVTAQLWQRINPIHKTYYINFAAFYFIAQNAIKDMESTATAARP